MELFLLLLVILLKLRAGGGESASAGAAAADPEQPQPGGGSCRQEWGAFLGQWDPGPGRETSAERLRECGRERGSFIPHRPAHPASGWVP